jgi:hypothetical protein
MLLVASKSPFAIRKQSNEEQKDTQSAQEKSGRTIVDMEKGV